MWREKAKGSRPPSKMKVTIRSRRYGADGVVKSVKVFSMDSMAALELVLKHLAYHASGLPGVSTRS
jgi:hypothetical protein